MPGGHCGPIMFSELSLDQYFEVSVIDQVSIDLRGGNFLLSTINIKTSLIIPNIIIVIVTIVIIIVTIVITGLKLSILRSSPPSAAHLLSTEPTCGQASHH